MIYIDPPFNTGVKQKRNRIPASQMQHQNEKPVPLMQELILKSPQGIILDPFMGSGLTLRAAKNLGRKAIGIELEEKYCELAAARLTQENLF